MRILIPFVVIGILIAIYQYVMTPAPKPPQAYVFPKQFSAEQTMVNDGRRYETKVYRDNGKFRLDADLDGSQVISIFRPDEQKSYIVSVDKKTIIVKTFDPNDLEQLKLPGSSDDKLEQVGHDKIDDFDTTKYKATSPGGSEYFLWVEDGQPFPVKISIDGKVTRIYSHNVQLGPPDPALFEPPAGYQVQIGP